MKNKRFFGIDLLRIIMCVVVVFVHFTPRRENPSFLLDEFQKLYYLAVPVFFLISFFFLSSKLGNDNRALFRDRMKRLGIPQVFWTIALWVGFEILYLTGVSDNGLTFKDFLVQLVLGKSYNGVMWYIVDTIILTILFLILYRAFNHKFHIVSLILIISAFILQYSHLNYALFGELPDRYRYTLGWIIEMMPYAFGGYLCYRIYAKVGVIRYAKLLIIPLAVLVHYNYALPWLDAGPAFGYAGIRYFAEAILTMFVFMDIEPYVSKPPFANAIRSVAPVTMGVYIIHCFVGTIISHFCNVIYPGIDNIFISLLTIVVSFIICLGIDRIPNLKVKMLVR